ncbi:MAG: FecR domain-containing protein [Gammaproteobacteria bacterium]|nr:FecR domain-containing protein [Gammaproteobacteria bacterium]
MMTLNNKFIRGLAGISLVGMIGVTGVAQATSSAVDARSNGVWTVESGQWLGRIVAALESDPAKRARLMEEIVFLNPQAFVNADPNRMRAGADLKLPGATQVAAKITPDPVLQAPGETVTMAERIGRITGMRGQLTATGKDGAARSLRRRSYVRQGDTLSTSKKGGAQVKFKDGAQIALRRDSSLRIDEYNWQGSEDGSEKAVMSLVKGGFRTITGAIGKVNKTNYRVNSPFATIGIRGTHYALMSCQGGSCSDLPSGNGAPDDGLYGGTAFGAISVDDEHEIGPQQYFRHDGQNFQTLMGPPAFLFAADTQIGDNSELGDVDSTAGGDGGGGEQGGDSFGAEGGTETGGLLAELPADLPGQEDDGLFTDGEQGAAQLAEGSAGGNGVAYIAAVVGSPGAFFGKDSVVDFFESGNQFTTGSFNNNANVLLTFDSVDGSDSASFSGPPDGNLLEFKAVDKPAFDAVLGLWDSSSSAIFDASADIPRPIAFVHSADATQNLTGLNGTGTKFFSSLHGFGSDEQGGGFSIGSGDIGFDVDFDSMLITQGYINVNDSLGRTWSLSGSGLNVALQQDARLSLSGGCLGGSCSSFTPADGFIFTFFLGPDADGAIGSYGAQTLTGAQSIAGTYVAEGVLLP